MDGVVFDFDGVLARSMEQHAEAYRRVLAPLGIHLTDRDVFLREGARSESIIRDFLAAAGLAVDDGRVRDLADHKQRVFRDLGMPALYPGAAELVHAVHQATPHTAVVTGTRRENLEAIIPELVGDFGAILSQESYTHDKPHPEPYARAAEALGLDPARLVAVENAARGVQSALAAGYGAVVAITTTLPRDELLAAGATAVVDDHAALLADLRERVASHK